MNGYLKLCGTEFIINNIRAGQYLLKSMYHDVVYWQREIKEFNFTIYTDVIRMAGTLQPAVTLTWFCPLILHETRYTCM